MAISFKGAQFPKDVLPMRKPRKLRVTVDRKLHRLRDFRPGMHGFIPLSFNASLNQSGSFPRSAAWQWFACKPRERVTACNSSSLLAEPESCLKRKISGPWTWGNSKAPSLRVVNAAELLAELRKAVKKLAKRVSRREKLGAVAEVAGMTGDGDWCYANPTSLPARGQQGKVAPIENAGGTSPLGADPKSRKKEAKGGARLV